MKQHGEIRVIRARTDSQKLDEPCPFVQLVGFVLREAVKAKASDVHFEPYADRFLVRFRVNGNLADFRSLGPEHASPVVARLKWILNMDLGVVSLPQDSRATFAHLGVDVRASSMPVTSGGEKIVLRLQYQSEKLRIADLGIDASVLEVILGAIRKKDGLILVSGPTGSGKTTTLYALLEEMDQEGCNISTLESPVEKRLPRINQANVHDYEDFASFQRALMRQDPDVILLGEIRDRETADLAMKLASTGHLVLSTIHANGARQVVDRMHHLGVDAFSLKENLRLSLAQRLVRRICDNCKVSLRQTYCVRNPKGCSHCQLGVTGRIALIEYLGKHEVAHIDDPTGIAMPTTLSKEAMKLATLGQIDFDEAINISE